MLDHVKQTINKYQMLVKGDSVLLAVSGGPDSIAMTYALKSLQKEYQLNLYIFHLNHKLRGRESDADAEFVAKVASDLDIPAFLAEENVSEYIQQNKLSLQEGAREIRYKLLEEKAVEVGATKIAIGQHANDQAETVLMRFLRGSGLVGLGGIAPVRDGRFIRPLIETSRKDIDEYLITLGVTARLDKSNLKTVYLRNKIRLELLPLLQMEYNSNISQVLCQMSGVVREENHFLEEIARESLDKILLDTENDEIVVDKKRFLALHLALKRRIIKLLWEKTVNEKMGLAYVHIDKALDFVAAGSSGNKINLPKGAWLVNSYNTFAIKRFGHQQTKSLDKSYSFLKIPGETITKEKVIKAEILPFDRQKEFRSDFDREIYLDYDLVKDGLLTLRNRLSGDTFSPLNGSGKKKLKDYFINNKIPREQRDEILLLTQNNVVLWVVGHSLNDNYKVRSKTKNILRISLDKN